jgi:hypothetical protein
MRNSTPTAPRPTWKSIVVIAILCLAGIHCSRSIFFDNVSWINLHDYAYGRERSPFQERVAMMPVLRIAADSPALRAASDSINLRRKLDPGMERAEVMSPEKLASIASGIASTLLAVAVLLLYGRKLGALYYLPAALFLVIVFASYASRYEAAYWYPYDLPHVFLFGCATMALLEGPIWLIFPLFVIDTVVRETAVYLIAVAAWPLARAFRWPRAVLALSAMFLIWAAIRLTIVHHFAGNASETGLRVGLNLTNLMHPTHWPQIASMLGFLLVPVWMARANLDFDQRVFLWLMAPCLICTLAFGVIIESRIALEWAMSVAFLASVELQRHFESYAPREA